MPLTMRDRQDWTIYADGKTVGRIYENGSASTAADRRWFWSVTVYVDPKTAIVRAGRCRRSSRPRPSSRRRGGAG
jgi:hypothetical protein